MLFPVFFAFIVWREKEKKGLRPKKEDFSLSLGAFVVPLQKCSRPSMRKCR